MARISKPFTCKVVTPDDEPRTFEVRHVSFPATDGQVGILGGRAPLVSLIGAGKLYVEEVSGTETEYFVAGGFARMNQDVLTIMAEECQPIRELDPEDVWEELTAARALPEDTPEQAEYREERIRACQMKFKLVQKLRQKRKEELRKKYQQG